MRSFGGSGPLSATTASADRYHHRCLPLQCGPSHLPHGPESTERG
jgi:hypothetical protein